MDRRDLFKISAGAAVAAKLSAALHRFFTPAEFALTEELTEMIIPADEKSGGAKAAKVAEYIDFRLSEAFDPAQRDQWREGLKTIDALSKEMHGSTFLAAQPDQRTALLTSIAANELHPQTPGEQFFTVLKYATIRAYYTSKTGIHDDLDYKGNVLQQGNYAGELP